MFFRPDYEGQFFFSTCTRVVNRPSDLSHILLCTYWPTLVGGKRHEVWHEDIMDGTSASKMFFSNLLAALACQRRARTRQQLIERDSTIKIFLRVKTKNFSFFDKRNSSSQLFYFKLKPKISNHVFGKCKRAVWAQGIHFCLIWICEHGTGQFIW